MSGPLVAVEMYGQVEVHAVGVIGDYATLCGLDGDDHQVGQRPATLPERARITCDHCERIILAARQYRVSVRRLGDDS